MVRQLKAMLTAAALTAAAAVGAAQTPQDQANQTTNQQAAPIERAYPNQNAPQYRSGQMPQPVGPAWASPVTIAPGQAVSPTSGEATATPIQGVLLRVAPKSSVREVSSDPQKLELSVDRGIANINVHDPAKDVLILIDLPGGQTQLLKNGLYTFDAETNTARVLKGEALAFPGSDKNADEKPLKVKENNKIVFNGTNVKPHEFAPYDARMDLLAAPPDSRQGGSGYYGYHGYAPYGDGFYGGYPYWAYDYPWAWGYPYYGGGWYPYGVGFGFGYGGGWGGGWGGYHGFHGGGFHGGGFHGRR